MVTEVVHYGAGNPKEMAVHLAYSYRCQPDIWPHLIDAAAPTPLADRIVRELCWHLGYLLTDFHTEMPDYLQQDPPCEECYLMPGPIHDDHTYFAFVHGHATTMRDRKGWQITRRDTFDELARGPPGVTEVVRRQDISADLSSQEARGRRLIQCDARSGHCAGNRRPAGRYRFTGHVAVLAIGLRGNR